MKKLNKLHISRNDHTPDRNTSSLKKVSWFKIVSLITILCCAIINYVNIVQLFQVVMDAPDVNPQNSFNDIIVYIKPLMISIFVTVMLVISPIILGKCISFCKLQGRSKLYIAFSISMSFVIFLFVLSLSWFRFIIEANHPLWVYEDPIIYPMVISVIYCAIMIAGIIVSILYGYINKDYYSKVVKES